jgi:hypothetical protein
VIAGRKPALGLRAPPQDVWRTRTRQHTQEPGFSRCLAWAARVKPPTCAEPLIIVLFEDERFQIVRGGPNPGFIGHPHVATFTDNAGLMNSADLLAAKVPSGQPEPASPKVRWKPNVTVAALIERDGRFLLVEEDTSDGLLLNNPAGHLDPGESPIQGVIRETL